MPDKITVHKTRVKSLKWAKQRKAGTSPTLTAPLMQTFFPGSHICGAEVALRPLFFSFFFSVAFSSAISTALQIIRRIRLHAAQQVGRSTQCSDYLLTSRQLILVTQFIQFSSFYRFIQKSHSFCSFVVKRISRMTLPVFWVQVTELCTF